MRYAVPIRGVLFLVLVLVQSIPAPPAQAAPAVKPRPNILFIFSDDHALQAIGAYGSKINETPNLDRLASQGMLFRHCLVTNSICGPSRATILTGKYSHRNGFYQNGDRFNGAQTTFPKLLQKVGYQTALVGKWHLESDPTGFNYWQILPGQGDYYNPRMIDNGRKVEHEGYVTDVITDAAIDWLKHKRDPARPFLMMCQHKAPHREWEPPLTYLTQYGDVNIPEPATLFDDYLGRGSAARMQDMTIAKTLNSRDLKLVTPPRLNAQQRYVWEKAYEPRNKAFREANLTGQALVRWKYQRYIKDYLRCVAAVDDSVGKLLKHLDDAGLADNTIVVYSSDQGFYLGEHGWFDKRWMYEESLHTPLIVRWPGVTAAGSENANLVSNLDFAETFLDAAGVPVPDDMQGRSLRPLLQGKTPSDWRKNFYYHYYEYPGPHDVQRHYGVRTERYKLIHFYHLGEWELYDLRDDPHEMTNVVGDPAYRGISIALQAELVRLRILHQVPEDPRPAK
jgi:arylsulfatase A-like enzyme